jgi:Myb/SANT-like DNA-binding domain
MWTNDQLRDLIDKRKAGNKDYHDLNNNRRYNFWRNIASEINIKFGTTYSGKQCKEKFSALVRDFKVYKKNISYHYYFIILNTKHDFYQKMKKYVDGDPKGKKTRLGETFFKEFKELFWEKPRKYHIYKYFIFYILILLINMIFIIRN